MATPTFDTRDEPTRFVHHLAGAALLGAVLGCFDAFLHGDPAAWSDNPLASVHGATNLVAIYAAGTMLVGATLPWRWLVVAAVGSFTVFQSVAAFLHGAPGAGLPSTCVAAAAGSVVATATTWLALLVFGRRAPHKRLLDVLLVLATIAASAVWALGDRETPRSYAAAERADTAIEAAASPNSTERPNVVLITLDTVRPDHLGPYGYRQVATPHLDDFARRGAVFEQAVVQASTTPPSHASILTGVTPAKHGVRAFEGSYALSQDYRTLAEVLGEGGYATGAVIASIPLAPGYGIARGFDAYDFDVPDRPYAFFGVEDTLGARVLERLQIVRDRSEYRSAEEQTERALRWIAAHASHPFFLWIHYFDAHDPYGPPRRHLALNRHPGRTTIEMLERTYLYDSEISYLDEQIGRVLTDLDRRGLGEQTVVAMISDHGEALGEHDYVGHSRELYQEQIRAAFLMRYPHGIRAGTRVPTQVRSIDLMPTVLELAHLPVPAGLEGRSLTPLLRTASSDAGAIDQADADANDRLAFAETVAAGKSRLISVSDGRFKMIADPESGREELYDLAADPGETRSLLAREAGVGDRLRREIGRYLAGTLSRTDETLTLQANARRRLRALGYLD